MRYRIGGSPGDWGGGTKEMLVLTAILGFVIGVALFYLARRGQQRWLVFWAVTLMIASVIYVVAMVFGYF